MYDFRKDILKDVRRIQEEMNLVFDHFHKLRHFLREGELI